MPEKKKVTIAPGTKIKNDGNAKQNGKTNGTKKEGSLSRTLNPIQRSKESIKRAYDVRRTRENYGDKIKSIQEEQDNDIRYLVEQIQYYRKDNEKLLRQQVMNFGVTLDDMDNVREELEHAKDTNDVLYHQVEARKEDCEKLQVEMDNLVARINSLAMDKSDLVYEKRLYEAEKVRLQKSDTKIQELVRSNRDLRNLLLKNKINPNTDASKITSTTMVKTASPKSESARVLQGTMDSRFPVIYNKRNLMSVQSMEDVRPIKTTRKQAPLRRSRSYNQQVVQNYMTAQEFFQRGRNNSLQKLHRSRFQVLV